MFVSRLKGKTLADKENDTTGSTATVHKDGSCMQTLLVLLIILATTAVVAFHYFSESNIVNISQLKRNRTERTISFSIPKPLPWVFAVTPTYKRYTQKADLVRLSQTLQHVKNLKWVVVEDSMAPSKRLARFLAESGLDYVHLNIRSPRKPKHKAVLQRNIALEWLRKNVDPHETPGVVYFMDDDNTYHRKLFEIMRATKRVAGWRVGFAGGVLAEGPIVKNLKVVGFHTNFAPKRAVPLDMAGFAVSIRHLIANKYVKFRSTPQAGFLESDFLMRLTTRRKLEPLANNSVYVWHTQTRVPHISRKNPTEHWIEV